MKSTKTKSMVRSFALGMLFNVALTILAIVPTSKGAFIRWDRSPTNEAVKYYRIFWQIDGIQVPIPVNKDYTTNVVDLTSIMLFTNRVYRFTVTAVNDFGESDPSTPVAWTNGVTTNGTSIPYTNRPTRLGGVSISP